jgi:hypothetical protein
MSGHRALLLDKGHHLVQEIQRSDQRKYTQHSGEHQTSSSMNSSAILIGRVAYRQQRYSESKVPPRVEIDDQ